MVPRSVSCELVYVDPTLTKADIDKHVKDFGYSSVPAVLDAHAEPCKSMRRELLRLKLPCSEPTKCQILYRRRIDSINRGAGQAPSKTTEHDLHQALDEALSGKPVSESTSGNRLLHPLGRSQAVKR